MSVPHLPVFGICGLSGSGKTTLIERILPHLHTRGLKVAVVKHGTHHVDADRPGKDSYRFFQAGADVLLQGPDQGFLRCHRGGEAGLAFTVETLAVAYDLVLIEGHKNYDVPKVWLLSEGQEAQPAGLTEVFAVLSQTCHRVSATLEILESFLTERSRQTPVLGCVLIGGGSTRMGRPKHLLCCQGRTWLERTVDVIGQVTRHVVIVGDGDVPSGLASCTRLPDVPHVPGPMAGLLAAMRWSPWTSWLVAACDMPHLSAEAMKWLLSLRRPGTWALVPTCPGPGNLQPLLATYEFPSRPVLEELACNGHFRLRDIASCPKVATPPVPQALAKAWTNFNSPAELWSLH